MKRIYKLFLVLAILCTSMVSNAQNDVSAFSLMRLSPFANFYNPGIRVPYNGVIGVGVSNINIFVNNSNIRYNNLFSTESNGDLILDAKKFVNSLDEQGNFVGINFSYDIINIGVRAGKMFVNLDWRIKTENTLSYSKDFVGLFVLGNGHYMGADNPCHFNLGLESTTYSEIGLGVQYDVNERLTVGVRPKILFGILNVNLNNDDTKIYTDPDTYVITADANVNIKAASVFPLKINKISDVAVFSDFNDLMDIESGFSSNIGFGVDFGASYLINRHFGVALGVNDLGFVKWNETKMKTKSSQNAVINDALITDIEDISTMNIDYESMLNCIVDGVWGDDTLVSGNAYKTSLKTKISLQGYYELNPFLRITAVGQMYYFNKKMRPSLTLAYSGSVLKVVDLMANVTVSKYFGSKVGLGLGIHLGPVNLYATADNILMLGKLSSSAAELLTSWNSAGLRMGLVFSLGKYQDARYRLEE
ncbi:MAG: DUF5723 family protein [Candidatus Limimorpha sp.]